MSEGAGGKNFNQDLTVFNKRRLLLFDPRRRITFCQLEGV